MQDEEPKSYWESPPKFALRLYAYLRVSGRGQVNGEGPDRQRETISAFCNQFNVALNGEFFDKGVSGKVEGFDRPAFSEMLEAIESRRLNGEQIDGIIVERMDRLARDLMVCEVLLAECRKRKIKVLAADRAELVDIASDDGDPTRKLIRQVMAALAEWEKSQTVLKLKKAREAIKRKTGKCEGRKPFGYYPMEDAMIQALKTFWTPTIGLQTIYTMLNEGGFLNRNGKQYDKGNLCRIIQRLQKKGELTQWTGHLNR